MNDDCQRTKDPGFAILLMIVGIGFVVFSTDISRTGLGNNGDPGPRMFPAGLGVCLILGAIADVTSWWFARGSAPRQNKERPAFDRGLLNIVVIVLSLAVYLALTPMLGFSVATVLFATGAMTWLGTVWWRAALISLALVAAIHVLFVLAFKVQLPAGPFAW